MTSEWNRPRLLARRRHRSVPLLLAVAFLGEHYQAAENLLGDIVERQTKTQSKGVVSVANGLEKGRGIHHLARGLMPGHAPAPEAVPLPELRNRLRDATSVRLPR